MVPLGNSDSLVPTYPHPAEHKPYLSTYWSLSRNTFLLYSSIISEYLYFTCLFFYTYLLLNTAPLHFPYIDVTYVRNNALGASHITANLPKYLMHKIGRAS